MTAAVADPALATLVAKIAADTGFRCGSYKAECVRRRVAVRMRAQGSASYAEYAAVLDRDATEYDRLLDVLTVNVTRFFRNRSTFELLAAEVLPALWDRGVPLRLWSAGTASGEEAYTLAILLHAHAAARGELGRLATARVLGTDIDRTSLDSARAGCYPAAALSETPDWLLDRFVPAAGGRRAVAAPIRALVDFAREDLLGALPPRAGFDLIACRHVIIYLDRATQEELLCRLHDALRPGGYLVLGRAETMLGLPRQLFTTVSVRERVFQRAA